MDNFKELRLTRQGTDIVIGVCDWTSMGRKKPVLYVEESGHAYKVASFNNVETAKWFIDKFVELVSGEGEYSG